MRLIDADALREKHCEGCSADVRESCKTDPVCASLMWVVEEPTIDAVEVVRCKDCVNYNTSCCADGFGWCEELNRGMMDDKYCSFGKLRSHHDSLCDQTEEDAT